MGDCKLRTTLIQPGSENFISLNKFQVDLGRVAFQDVFIWLDTQNEFSVGVAGGHTFAGIKDLTAHRE